MTEIFARNSKTDLEAPCRIAIVGARGRMGERIHALLHSDKHAVVVARFDRDEALVEDGHGVDVVIDFSSDAGCREAIKVSAKYGAAVMQCANTSLGVAVTRHLAREAARMLAGSGWTVDIVETHHDKKLDAPSGTALALAASLGQGGMTVAADRIHALRAGDTVGEHEIRLAGPFERITITHDAVSRDLFAAGAIRAAKWLKNRAPGMYSLEASLVPEV